MSDYDATDRPLLAVALRLGSAFAFSVMNALIKVVEGHGASLSDTLFFRQLFALPVVLAAMALGPGLGAVRTRRIGAHATRAAVGATSMSCMFLSVLMLPLAEATTLTFTVPIFATLLGVAFLGERVGAWRWGAILMGFGGVLIVTRPGSGALPALGIAAGLTAAVLSATVSILLRRLNRTERAETIVFWFTTLSLPPFGLAFILNFAAHPLETWGWLIAIGLVGGIGQLLMTTALRNGPVSLVVPMDYSGMVWASLFGWLVFGLLPGGWTWIGAPVIVLSGLAILWRERVRAQKIVEVLADE